MAVQTVTSVAGLNGQDGANSLRLDPSTLLFQLTAVANDLGAFAALVVAYLADGVMVDGTLAISATAEDFKTTTTAYYRIGGVQYSKAATDNLSFSAADTINTGTDTGSFWGVWLVQVNAAGTISTKSPSADQVYTTEALAIAALPAVTAGNVALGYITVNANDDSAWTANTDDLTDASDCAEANFYDTAAPTAVSNGADTITYDTGVTP